MKKFHSDVSYAVINVVRRYVLAYPNPIAFAKVSLQPAHIADSPYKRFLQPLLLFVFFLFSASFSKASHITGGQLVYTALGNDDYLFSFSMYRDCGGITPSNSVILNYGLDGGTTQAATASLLSVTEISVICPGQVTTCNGGSVDGLQEYTYTTTLHLPPSPGQNYTISFTECCRSNEIQNLTVPTSEGIYIEAKLNPNTLINNSSPTLLNKPPGFFCLNYAGTYSPNAYDNDGDSLSFSLVDARQSVNSNVTYNPGLNGLTPFASSTGVTIDPATGLMVFTPTVAGTNLVTIKVQEYRGGTLVGEITREFFIISEDCLTNVPPVINALTNAIVPVGQSYSQNISATDVNGAQSITLTSTAGNMPPAILSSTPSTGTVNGIFSFTPTSNDAGKTFNVAIMATDDACHGITDTKLFSIKVPGLPLTIDNIPYSFCPGANVSIPFSSGIVFNPGNIFSAELSDSSGSFAMPTVIGTKVSTLANDTIVASLPLNLFASHHYKMRVTSSSPALIGPAFPFYLTVNAAPVISATATPSMVPANTAFQLDVNPPASCFGDYIVNTIPYSPVTSAVTNLGPTGDDIVSNAIPIGFTFPFYCTNYTSLYISTNGFVSFSNGEGSGCCSGQLIPNAASPNNLIALGWTDLFVSPPTSTIEYFNLSNPNRFVIQYTSVSHCCGPTPPQLSGQIILYEDGTIDLHSTDVAGNGIMTQGVENSNGTVATAVLGRNALTWSTSNDAYRFIPSGAAGYSWSPTLNMNDATLSNPIVSSINASTTYTVTYTNSFGCSGHATTYVELLSNSVSLTAKAFLSGPYVEATGLMYDSLRTLNLIPTNEPYSAAPFNKPQLKEIGGETVSNLILAETGSQGIVDWVYLELRDALNPALLKATKKALIRRDGAIVSHVDGTSPVTFDTVSAGNYYVALKHRNHLGVMSSVPLQFLSNTPANIDFSVAGTAYTYASFVSTPLRSFGTVRALWSSDANFNKNVKYNGLSNDKDVVLTAIGGAALINNTIFNVYRPEDLNMDGKIKYNNADNDRTVIINAVGVNTPNKILSQHTPN